MEQYIPQVNRFHLNFFCVVIIVTVFSQIESVMSITRPLMYMAWITLAGILLFQKGHSFKLTKYTRFYIICFFIYTVYIGICSFSKVNYFSGVYFRTLIVPLLVIIVSNLMMEEIDKYALRMISVCYIIAAFVLTLYIHRTYFSSYSEWLGAIYTYNYWSKNQAAPIIAIALFMIVFVIKPKFGMKGIVWYAAFLYMTFVMFMTQCRTAILAIAVSIIIYVIAYSNNKVRNILGIIALLLIIYYVPSLHSMIDKALSLTKHTGASLNTISSGRIEVIEYALQYFRTSKWIGVGKYYVDCSYVSLLTESGIIGFLIVEPIWMYRIITVLNETRLKSKEIGRYHVLLVLLTVFYFIESLLEGTPPFGPGATSFMYWFLCEGLSRNALIESSYYR